VNPPATDPIVTLLVADFAAQHGDALTVVNAGRQFYPPQPTPSAVAAWVEFPWTGTSRQHILTLDLTDEDGHPVHIQPGQTGFVIELRADPPGPDSIPGVPIRIPFAFSIPPFSWVPGRRYEWTMRIDGDGAASVVFHVARHTEVNP
jgi:hypothetical protein